MITDPNMIQSAEFLGRAVREPAPLWLIILVLLGLLAAAGFAISTLW